MKSRLLVSLMVIAMAAALIGGATMAWFTDEAQTNPVTFTAGTLLIDMTDPVVTTDNFDQARLDRLNPGDIWEYEFEVENVGTKSFNWGIYVCWQDDVLSEAERAEMFGDREGFGGSPLSEKILWTVYVDYGTGEEVFLEDQLLPAEGGPLGALMEALPAGSEPVKFRIVAELPGEGTGNAYQGSGMDLVLGVKAWQTTNNAPAPTLDDVECPFEDDQPID
jgi:predicted ribosomally synthesized peptide with SipW-like signal peptide